MFTAALVLPFFADTFWALELPGHFRAQLAIGAIVATLGFAALRAWRHLAVSAVLAGVVAGPVLLLWVPGASGQAGDIALSVLSLNVSFYRHNHAVVRELLRKLQPDVVGLVEITDEWMTQLESLDDLYPHRLIEPTGPHSGLALLSRYGLASAEIRPLAGTRFLVATLEVHGRPLALGVIHTASPVWGTRVARRNNQLQALAGVRREFSDREFVLMGDLNTSPWSLAFRRLTAETGLRNAAAGFGYLPTWPAGWPWLGIPIDHCLVSDGIVVSGLPHGGPNRVGPSRDLRCARISSRRLGSLGTDHAALSRVRRGQSSPADRRRW